MYADFSKFKVCPDHEALCDAAYEAGKAWGEAGNKKLPRTMAILGETVVIQGLNDAGQAFRRGWKSCK